ncbi:MAG: hypothetical protein P8Y54_15295 [Xanthomonadales bacterium]
MTHERRKLLGALLSIALVSILVSACASAPSPVASMPEGDFRQRIVTQEVDGVRVSAGVPSAQESKALFGKPLYKRGIQPVWLKIENERDLPVSFLPVGLDPMFYSASEVAFIDQPESRAPVSLASRFFVDQAMQKLMVQPGDELSGFIFTRLDEGTKTFNVDLLDAERFTSLTFFIPVPGLARGLRLLRQGQVRREYR